MTSAHGFRVLCALLALAAAPLAACWSPEHHSVRFNQARPDFFRIPRTWRHDLIQYRARRPEAEAPLSWSWWSEQPSRSQPLLYSALKLEAANRQADAAAIYERFRLADDDPSDQYLIRFRESLPDRIGALRQARTAVERRACATYLRARDAVNAERWDEAEALLAPLRGTPYGGRAGYLSAAILFRRLPRPDGAERALPRFIRAAEAPSVRGLSLFMQGRCHLILSVEPSESFENEVKVTSVAGISRALRCFTLAAADPILHSEALNMAGRCQTLLGDRPAALLNYCRILAGSRPEADPPGVVTSIRLTLRRMTAAEHRRFQTLAQSHPAAIVPYLDVQLRTELWRTGAANLTAFCVRLVRDRPELPVRAALLTRLAQLAAGARQHERAARLAEAAIRRSAPGIERDEARWIHGTALQSLDRIHPALREFEALSRSSVGRYRRGAHEAAAVLCERTRDYVGALHHYFELEYDLDYAYLLDVLAPREALLSFVTRYPRHPRRELVIYSLGIRQFREGDYAAASQTLSRVRTFAAKVENSVHVATSRGKPRVSPEKAAGMLRAWDQARSTARTADQRARAAYDAAAFIFHQRHLLFYNAALWGGHYTEMPDEGPTPRRAGRTWAFDMQGGPYDPNDPQGELGPSEQATLRRYHERHACLWQALQRFRRVAESFPRSPEAPRALYSAALCCSFLQTLDSYWSNSKLPFYAMAIGHYHQIQRDYPDHPLAAAARRFGGSLQAAQSP